MVEDLSFTEQLTKKVADRQAAQTNDQGAIAMRLYDEIIKEPAKDIGKLTEDAIKAKESNRKALLMSWSSFRKTSCHCLMISQSQRLLKLCVLF